MTTTELFIAVIAVLASGFLVWLSGWLTPKPFEISPIEITTHVHTNTSGLKQVKENLTEILRVIDRVNRSNAILKRHALLTDWPADLTPVLVEIAKRSGEVPLRRDLENFIGPIPKMSEFLAWELSRQTPLGYEHWRSEWC